MENKLITFSAYLKSNKYETHKKFGEVVTELLENEGIEVDGIVTTEEECEEYESVESLVVAATNFDRALELLNKCIEDENGLSNYSIHKDIKSFLESIKQLTE